MMLYRFVLHSNSDGAPMMQLPVEHAACLFHSGVDEYLVDHFLGRGEPGAQPVGLVALPRWPEPPPPRHDLALLTV